MGQISQARTMPEPAADPRVYFAAERTLLAWLRTGIALSPSQKSKLENARKGDYPPTFPLRLMFKDFKLIDQRAMELSLAMPVTTAAAQVAGVEHARQSSGQGDEDFSAVIRTMQQMAGLVEWATIGNEAYVRVPTAASA